MPPSSNRSHPSFRTTCRQAARSASLHRRQPDGSDLAYVGFGGAFAGKLLWPAVILHAILTALLARAWIQSQKPDASNEQAKK